MSNLSVEVLGEVWEGYTLEKPTFTRIEKEPHTQGYVYIITSHSPVKDAMWVSQSMPVLCAAMNKFADAKVNAATFYRILRGETVSALHKGFCVYKSSNRDVEIINARCQEGSRTLVFTHSPDKWRFEVRKDQG
jgi:hypothetical protein